MVERSFLCFVIYYNKNESENENFIVNADEIKVCLEKLDDYLKDEGIEDYVVNSVKNIGNIKIIQ